MLLIFIGLTIGLAAYNTVNNILFAALALLIAALIMSGVVCWGNLLCGAGPVPILRYTATYLRCLYLVVFVSYWESVSNIIYVYNRYDIIDFIQL